MRDCTKKTALSATTIISAVTSFACLCIAVSTDHWLYTEEKQTLDTLTPGNQSARFWSTGLWRKCWEDKPSTAAKKNCTYINYFNQVDKDGLKPTEAIILSLRRSTLFPLISLFILLAGEIVALMSHYDRRKKVLTFVSGILFVIAGLCTLIGIILYIGAITEEAGNMKPSVDGPKFIYWYGASFVLTVTSFTSAELTGVLSVYLYISRHKHAYRKKVKRLTTSGSGNGNNGSGNGNGNGTGGSGSCTSMAGNLERHLQMAAVGPVVAGNDFERVGNSNNIRAQVASNHYVPLSAARSNGRLQTGSGNNSVGDNMVAMGGGAQAAVVIDGGRQYYSGAFAPVLRQGPAAAAVVGLTGGMGQQGGSAATATMMRDRYIVDQQQSGPPIPYYALAASGRDLTMMGPDYGMDLGAPASSFNGSAIVCRGSPVGSAIYRRSMDSLLLPADHMSLCGGIPGGGGGGGGDIGRRTTPV